MDMKILSSMPSSDPTATNYGGSTHSSKPMSHFLNLLILCHSRHTSRLADCDTDVLLELHVFRKLSSLQVGPGNLLFVRQEAELLGSALTYVVGTTGTGGLEHAFRHRVFPWGNEDLGSTRRYHETPTASNSCYDFFANDLADNTRR